MFNCFFAQSASSLVCAAAPWIIASIAQQMYCGGVANSLFWIVEILCLCGCCREAVAAILSSEYHVPLLRKPAREMLA